MTSYYKTNAFYVELEKYDDTPFVWTSGNAWILVYADSAADAKVIALVLGKTTMQSSQRTKSRLQEARLKAVALAEAAGTAFVTIMFDDEATAISDVSLDGSIVSLGEMKDWFFMAGLPVKGSTTSKAINDAESSAYHHWQRENLGAIKVSDIDLLRLAPNTVEVVEIIELKRSYISLQQWRPYRQDFQNFNVLADLAVRAGVRFTIAYNVRVTQPSFRDDASRISLFAYSRTGGARALGVVSFESFLRKGTPI